MSDSIAIVQAFAELRYGAVVHMRENSLKYGHNLGQTLYCGSFLNKLPLPKLSWIIAPRVPALQVPGGRAFGYPDSPGEASLKPTTGPIS